MRIKKYQYYLCHKKDNSVWFSCDTKAEAGEWREISIIKANEPSSNFYIRKELRNGK